MKLLTTIMLILICFTALGSDEYIIFFSPHESSNVYDEPDIANAKTRHKIEAGDSCIIVAWVQEKTLVPTDWYMIMTLDYVGYIYAKNFSLPDSIVQVLKEENKSSSRYSEAYTYFERNRSRIIKAKEKRTADNIKLLKSEIKRLEDSLSRFGLIVNHSSFTSDFGLTDVDIRVLNCKKGKTIKYITFTLTAFNPVNDPIGTKSVRGVGPIKPFDKGEYNFQSVFYSNVFDYCKLISIKIIYMDGSTENINSQSAIIKKANSQKAMVEW